MRRASVALVLLLCVSASPTRADSLTRAGATIVVSVASNTYGPLENVQVRVQAARLSARTDWMGEVKLGPLPQGTHRVEVRLLGYMPASADIQVGNDTVAVFFVLEPIHVVLDTLRTVARMVSPNMAGYERRKAMGIGRFLDDTLLDRQQLKNLPIALSMLLPGLQAVTTDVPGKYVLLSKRSSGRMTPSPCLVDVYVEGARFNGDLQDFGPSDLAGIEFYSIASAPVEYRRPSSGTEPACQVLLLWLRY
jgi:hypothetical protein